MFSTATTETISEKITDSIVTLELIVFLNSERT